MRERPEFDSIGLMETIRATFDYPTRENLMREESRHALRLDFDRKLKPQFHGTEVTSDTGLLAKVAGPRILFREFLDRIRRLPFLTTPARQGRCVALLKNWGPEWRATVAVCQNSKKKRVLDISVLAFLVFFVAWHAQSAERLLKSR
jgi:hypothetical protein